MGQKSSEIEVKPCAILSLMAMEIIECPGSMGLIPEHDTMLLDIFKQVQGIPKMKKEVGKGANFNGN
ncbi:hypothetical protein WISP_04064 [Willisornis vidua]|uniref:Uncharacterized protein n=1 Tax=Willisornis vidua TaxID=1566151 RepID=A0ABQ9DWI9_9PASS|nr:hypothetical protein WISP_04064 [Willisornis vidua]